MSKSIKVKNVDVVTITKKNTKDIGFIRIDIQSLFSKEDEDTILSLKNKYPQNEFSYVIIADNSFYLENETGAFIKKSRTKVEELGLRDINFETSMETGSLKVSVVLTKK